MVTLDYQSNLPGVNRMGNDLQYLIIKAAVAGVLKAFNNTLVGY